MLVAVILTEISRGARFKEYRFDCVRKKVTRNKVLRYIDRNELVSRRVTHQQTVWTRRLSIGFHRNCNLSMDEKPVFYDPEVSSTFAPRGSKKVSIEIDCSFSSESTLDFRIVANWCFIHVQFKHRVNIEME